MNKHIEGIATIHGSNEIAIVSASLTSKNWMGSMIIINDNDSNLAIDSPHSAEDLCHVPTDVIWLNADVIITASDLGGVYCWKITSDRNCIECMHEKLEHNDLVSSVSLNDGKTEIISSSWDRSVKIWDINEFVCSNTLTGHFGAINQVQHKPGCQHVFATCSQDCRVLLWDTRKPRPATVLGKFLGFPHSIAFQPSNANNIVIGCETGELHCLDLRSASSDLVSSSQTSPHKRCINALKFSPNETNLVATASDDCSAATIDVTSNTVVCRQSRHEDYVRDVAWSYRNGNFYTCGWDSQIYSLETNANCVNGDMKNANSESVMLSI